MYVIVMDDDETSWDTFHKTHITRGKAGYVRVPAPECKVVVFTTAEVGEVLGDDREDVVEAVLSLQPLDGRRLTKSQRFKFNVKDDVRQWIGSGSASLSFLRRSESRSMSRKA